MDASKLIGYEGYFATRLRDLMKSAKVTQQDLAAAVGTTRQAISQYADGSVQPNIEKLYKIAEFFHVPADYLLGLEPANIIATQQTLVKNAKIELLDSIIVFCQRLKNEDRKEEEK